MQLHSSQTRPLCFVLQKLNFDMTRIELPTLITRGVFTDRTPAALFKDSLYFNAIWSVGSCSIFLTAIVPGVWHVEWKVNV